MGFTLIELMVVLVIIGVVAGAVLLSFNAVNRTTAKANASKMGAAIRYLYDRAITTGGYYRLVIDLSGNKYWAERSDERFYLVRDKEQAPGRGRAPDEEEKERKLKEEEEREQQYLSTLAKTLQPPPKPRRARFQAFKDSTLPKVDLRGCKVRDVFTPRQREPYTEGKAYLYFFPDGHTERALIHVADTSGDVYTLIVQPLTGRVEVRAGDVPVPRGFGEYDDEGNAETPR